jgi:hypothetical protein
VKLPLKNIKKFFDEDEIDAIKKFISFLQKQVPLNKGVNVEFTDSRPYNMTTGLRTNGHNIFVLSKGRLLVDILRTIAHEWVHEYQHQKLSLPEKEKVQNIGGHEENLANIVAGIIFKKFEKENENIKKVIYGEG